MNRVYLVRHGENLANLTKEFSHRLVDYDLTEKGVLQAQQTAGYLAGKQVTKVYSSPLKRADQTAAIIAARLGLPYQTLDEFREVNVGALEVGPVSAEKWIEHNEIIAAWFTGEPQRRFPEGENMIELQARFLSGLHKILDGQDGQNIVIVGHGGIFTIGLGCIYPTQDLLSQLLKENHNGSVSELLLAQNGDGITCELVRWADASHLHGPAANFVPGGPDRRALYERGELA